MTLSSIQATIVFGPASSPGSDRKAVAKELQMDVLELKKQLVED